MDKSISTYYCEEFNLAVQQFHFFSELSSKARTIHERLGLREEALSAYARGLEALAKYRAELIQD